MSSEESISLLKAQEAHLVLIHNGIEKLLESFDDNFYDLKEYIDVAFTSINKNIEEQNERFDDIEQRQKAMDTKLDLILSLFQEDEEDEDS